MHNAQLCVVHWLVILQNKKSKKKKQKIYFANKLATLYFVDLLRLLNFITETIQV